MKAHISSNQEDYLESIYKIIQERGVVRVKDIADDLDVSKPSVTSALQTLARDGLIHYEPYGIITLVDVGKKKAQMIYQKHCTIQEFFQNILGIEPDEAARHACLMEHGMSELVIKRVIQFMRFHYDTEGPMDRWHDKFKKFCETYDIDTEDVDAVRDYLKHID